MQLQRWFGAVALGWLAAHAAAQSLVRDIRPGFGPVAPHEQVFRGSMHVHGGNLLLGLGLWGSGFEPRWSDGTLAGTHQLLDIASGYQDSYGGFTVSLPGVVVFHAGNSLWRTDGTTTGTIRIGGSYRPYPVQPTLLGNAVYFLAQPVNSSSSWSLWRSDGTSAGTAVVATGVEPPDRGHLQPDLRDHEPGFPCRVGPGPRRRTLVHRRHGVRHAARAGHPPDHLRIGLWHQSDGRCRRPRRLRCQRRRPWSRT